MQALMEVLAVGIAALALAVAPDATAHAYGGWGGYGYPMMGYGGWFLGPLFMILFIVLIIAAVVLLVRWLGSASSNGGLLRGPTKPDPLDILKERFARGEMTVEEYEQRKRALGG